MEFLQSIFPDSDNYFNSYLQKLVFFWLFGKSEKTVGVLIYDDGAELNV